MAGVGSKPGERRGGRKKGTPNRRTVQLVDFRDAMVREGCDPLAILAKAALGKIKNPLRVRAAIELAKYGWHQLVRSEFVGVSANLNVNVELADPKDLLASVMARQAERERAQIVHPITESGSSAETPVRLEVLGETGPD